MPHLRSVNAPHIRHHVHVEHIKFFIIIFINDIIGVFIIRTKCCLVVMSRVAAQNKTFFLIADFFFNFTNYFFRYG